MSDETMELRIKSLEESRREQVALNQTITESLHRIEMALAISIAKQCPLPGHCLKLEDAMKGKWNGDKDRFERLEARAGENDDWHKEIETRMDTKLDALRASNDSLKTSFNRVSGAMGILVILIPVGLFILNYMLGK